MIYPFKILMTIVRIKNNRAESLLSKIKKLILLVMFGTCLV